MTWVHLYFCDVKFFQDVIYQKLLKWVDFSRSYSNNIKGGRGVGGLLRHAVVDRCCYIHAITRTALLAVCLSVCMYVCMYVCM